MLLATVYSLTRTSFSWFSPHLTEKATFVSFIPLICLLFLLLPPLFTRPTKAWTYEQVPSAFPVDEEARALACYVWRRVDLAGELITTAI